MATASVSNGTTERLNLQDEINRKLAQARGICKVIQLADFSEIFPGEALQLDQRPHKIATLTRRDKHQISAISLGH